jgi:putative aldouronate transport system substrate-binding protein
MRKPLICMVLAFCLLAAVPLGALAAYNDHTDYSQYPLVKEGESLSVSVATPRSVANGSDPESTWFWIWSKEATGIDFQVEQILATAVEERKSLMFASGDLPDLLFGVSLTAGELVRYGTGEGLLLPLNDYITPEIMPHLSKWLEKHPEGTAYCTAPDGNIYTLPGFSDFFIQGNGPITLQVNQEWLQAAGLEMPQTLDEFTAMLYAFKALKPDAIPLGGGAIVPTPGVPATAGDPRSYLINAFGYLWPDTYDNPLGVEPALREGNVVVPAYDDTFAEVLALLNRYYADDIIAKDFFTLDQTTAFAQLAEDQIGAYQGPVYLALPEKEDFSKWEVASPLTSQWNDKKQIGTLNKFRYGYVSLSAKIDPTKVETILRYLDYFYSDLGGMYLWCGPSNTSADTLGIVGGYLVDEKNSYVWVDTQGTAINSQTFMEGQAANMAHGFGNRSHPLNEEVFAKGVTNRPEMRSYYYNADHIVPYQYDPNFGSGALLLGVNKYLEPYRTTSYPMVVYYDEETTLDVSDLMTVIKPYIESEVAKFITGARDLGEFPQFQKELEALGIQELLGYYENAYANYLNAL